MSGWVLVAVLVPLWGLFGAVAWFGFRWLNAAAERARKAGGGGG